MLAHPQPPQALAHSLALNPGTPSTRPVDSVSVGREYCLMLANQTSLILCLQIEFAVFGEGGGSIEKNAEN